MATKKKLSGRTEKAAGLFQFKITLLGVEPAVWRRIVVADCTPDKLHEYIQTSMGWTNSHLHEFSINKKVYGDPELLCEGEPDPTLSDSTKTLVSAILPTEGKRFSFKYVYDMGDAWEHEIKFEGRSADGVKSPACLDGARACPPEDCGGAWGYTNLLDAIKNEDHEQHEDLAVWIGGSWDAEVFSAQAATKAMRKGLPEWRVK